MPESSFIRLPPHPPVAAQWGTDYVRGKQVQREEVALAEQLAVPFLERGAFSAPAVSAEGGARLRRR